MKFKQVFARKRSVIFSWLFSYFSVIAVCISISAVVYFQAGRIVADEMNRSNRTLIGQIRNSIDSRLNDIQILGSQISFDKRLQNLYYLSGPLTNYDYYAEKQTMDDFTLLKSANNYIDFFYVRIGAIPTYPASDGTYSDDILYSQYFSDKGFTYDQWVALQVQVHAGEFIPLYGDGTAPKSIAYMRTLSDDPAHRVTLAILFNQSKLLDSIQNVNMIDDSSVCILDKTNRMISFSGKSGLSGIRYGSLHGSQGTSYQKLGGKEIAISYIRSEVNDWMYVTSVPVAIYTQKVKQMRRLTYGSLLACFLLGGLISLFFAQRNFSPIRDILRYVTKVQKKENKPATSDHNELSFIRDFITRTQHEKEKYFSGWEKHSAAVRENFLIRLFKGQTNPAIPLDEMLSTYSILFTTDFFGVMLVKVEDFSRLFDEKEYDGMNMVHFAVSNVAEEIAGQGSNCYVVNCGDMVACLLNFRQDDAEADRAEMLRTAEICRSCLTEKLTLDVTISVSSIKRGRDGIPAAYREAVEAMEYRLIQGSEAVITFDAIPPANNRYPYSLERERALVNGIKTGSFDAASVTLNEMFLEIRANDLPSVDMAKCFVFGLANTMMQTLQEVDIICDNRFMASLRPVDRLLACKNLDGMKNVMEQILREICGYIHDVQQKNRDDKLKNTVIEYIRKNYRDVNLGVAGIARGLGMNPIALSHFFRVQTGGETLLDCINRCRLDQAKRLLHRRDCNIYSVAVEVGYYNSNALIRAFKRYEGMTPGKFRETTDEL